MGCIGHSDASLQVKDSSLQIYNKCLSSKKETRLSQYKRLKKYLGDKSQRGIQITCDNFQKS